jgi:hypothetical protein
VNLQSLIIGVPCLLSSLGMMIFPHKRRLRAEAKVIQRKAQLAAGAPERFFEEARSIDAYPLPATDTKWRIKGVLLAVCGLSLILLSFFR